MNKKILEENNKLKKQIKNLKKQNKKLQKIISIAKNWMKREVKENILKVAKKKLSFLTKETKKSFFNNNIENLITQKISDFFGEILILNIPSCVIDNIISAEINYYNLKENPISDGLSVITGYHKTLDILIETYITKGFRKYCKKNGQEILRDNDILEKFLHSVVTKGYILSVGRLYHLVKTIKNGEELKDYGKAFYNYLKKYYYLEEILCDDETFDIFSKLINLEILGKKRHSGKISFEDTKKARKLLIGNFKDKNCFIYKLIETQNLNY